MDWALLTIIGREIVVGRGTITRITLCCPNDGGLEYKWLPSCNIVTNDGELTSCVWEYLVEDTICQWSPPPGSVQGTPASRWSSSLWTLPPRSENEKIDIWRLTAAIQCDTVRLVWAGSPVITWYGLSECEDNEECQLEDWSCKYMYPFLAPTNTAL